MLGHFLWCFCLQLSGCTSKTNGISPLARAGQNKSLQVTVACLGDNHLLLLILVASTVIETYDAANNPTKIAKNKIDDIKIILFGTLERNE